MTRLTRALVFALGASACASVPPPAPAPPPAATFEQKMSWMLGLEDRRVLRDPAPELPPAVPQAPVRGASVAPAPAPPPPPDLLRLLGDGEARIRRRAALAVGRAGLVEGVPPLVALLADADPEVRQMAAFALGLIGDGSARVPLVGALADPSAAVKGSAAEALGLIGDAAAVQPIARMAAEIVASGALATVPADDLDAARDTLPAAFRLALSALVRLKSYDGVAAAALDPAGQPRVRWWPVAFALGRLEDPRGLPALLTLVKEAHPYTRAFAAKGLGAMKDRAAGAALLPLVEGPDTIVAIEAIRSLARLREAAAGPMLVKLLRAPGADAHLRLEAATALGGVGGAGAADVAIDLLGDPSSAVRAAAIRSLAQIDAEGFIAVLSGLDQDAQWTVRAALASVLGTLSPDAGLPRLRGMLADSEPKVVPAVLAAIARLHPPDAGRIMIERLTAADPAIRAAAATAIGSLKPPDAQGPLAEAYARGAADTTYIARAAALAALAAYGAADATPVLMKALDDKDWAVRVRAAAILKAWDPVGDATRRIRPAPSANAGLYAAPRVVNPPFSTEAYIETDRGTIRIELAVLDAPLTVENFVALARRGFFDGTIVHRVVPDFVVQAGDPRGDGEGGPGYTIRDEINEQPFVRGTLGMALDWADTGGSQFFITHSPQPHLDAKYTVFGRVTSGMEVVDRIEPGDVIRRVRIWDGIAAN